MIELMSKGRPFEKVVQYFRGICILVPNGIDQCVPTLLFGVQRAFDDTAPGPGAKQSTDAIEELPGNEIVAGEVKMNVLVKEFISDDAVGAFRGQGCDGIDKFDTIFLVMLCDASDDFVDACVGTEAKCVEIACTDIMLKRIGRILELIIALCQAKVQVGVIVVDCGRSSILVYCFLKLFLLLQADACVVETLPLGQRFSGQVRAVQ